MNTMNTLNTIIEEETEFLFSGENEVARFKHQGIGNCTKENITTAMQRAYEAGRISWLRSEIEKLEKDLEINGSDVRIDVICKRLKDSLKNIES